MKCAARNSNVGANDPQECDAPFCGCNEAWAECIRLLQECGWGPTAALERDNKALTKALQRIEAGEHDPYEIATEALELPSHKTLLG